MGKRGAKKRLDTQALEASKAFKKQERRAKQAHRRGRNKKKGSEWQSDWRRFADQVKAYGLRLRNVREDGNCLFRAVGDQLWGNEDLCVRIRTECCNFMVENRDDFAPFVFDEDYDEYIAEMRKDGTWGGNLELQALSLKYDCNIIVHHLAAPRYEVFNQFDKTIHLSYHNGEHYASVRNEEDPGGAPATPIDLRLKNQSVKGGADDDFVPKGEAKTKQEQIVSDITGCQNFEHIRRILKDNMNDVDASVEFVFFEQNHQDGGVGVGVGVGLDGASPTSSKGDELKESDCKDNGDSSAAGQKGKSSSSRSSKSASSSRKSKKRTSKSSAAKDRPDDKDRPDGEGRSDASTRNAGEGSMDRPSRTRDGTPPEKPSHVKSNGIEYCSCHLQSNGVDRGLSNGVGSVDADHELAMALVASMQDLSISGTGSHAPSDPSPRSKPTKPDRMPKSNQHCHCGSGKRYKRCCQPLDRMNKLGAASGESADGSGRQHKAQKAGGKRSKKADKKLTNKERKELAKRAKAAEVEAELMKAAARGSSKKGRRKDDASEQGTAVEDLGSVMI